jgi:hypothetical protein
VLVKIGRTGRISEAQIQKGLEWVLDHAEEFQIRLVNISAGGDFEESYLTNSLSQTVEKCSRAGLTVVCAVGNAGTHAGSPGFAAGQRALLYRSGRFGRSELARPRAARHVSLILWTDD